MSELELYRTRKFKSKPWTERKARSVDEAAIAEASLHDYHPIEIEVHEQSDVGLSGFIHRIRVEKLTAISLESLDWRPYEVADN